MGGGKIPPPTVVRMPNANDPDIIAAQNRAAAMATQRGGRQSTILSDSLKANSVNGSVGKLGT